MTEDVREELQKIFANSKGVVMTSKERKNACILIVDGDTSVRHTMRQSLLSLGYNTIFDAPDPALALQKLEEADPPFTHVIFESKNTRMPGRDFLISVLEVDKDIIVIPSAYDPTVDDVFDLLIVGARGYICKPFTTGGIDESIAIASKGEPLSDALSYARSRNEALASVILSSLNKLALIMKQAKKFKTARRELPSRQASFRRAVDLGMTFAKGGPPALRDTLIRLCLQRCESPAAKIGRVRTRTEDKKRALLKDPQPESAPS